MLQWTVYILCAFMAYLLGSLNGGILVTRLLQNADIRESGSGNAGFTNVKRVYGAKSAAMVFVVDVVKSVVACGTGGFFVSQFTDNTYLSGVLLCGLAAQLGHIFPLYFGFKGGKGFICGMITVLMADWRIFLVALAILGLVTLVTNYVSLGSMCATFSYALLFVIMYSGDIGAYSLACTLAVVVFISHKENIKRLIAGNENKTYFFSKDKKEKEK